MDWSPRTRRWGGLSDAQPELARELLDYVAKGRLFERLNVLDNVASLENHPGSFELFHVDGESRTRLNDPEGDLLYDLFNETE